jgi:hypothetical protein
MSSTGWKISGGPTMHVIAVALLLVPMAQQVVQADIATTVPRNYYGAMFEPVDTVIHGAGQTYFRGGPLVQAFDRYADVTGANAYPITYADYNNWTNGQSWYNGLDTRLDIIEAADNVSIVPQLGTVLPNYALSQPNIDAIVAGLASLNRPVFYRPGYEANGPWNGYDAAMFIQNFRTLSDAIRAADLPVAMVWNVVVGDFGSHSNFSNVMNYYPGDDYVDWWSMNVFGAVEFTAGKLAQKQLFFDAADAAGFPILIGEATPQFDGAESANDWDHWFEDFFDLIEHNPEIKAHTYINWDWAQTVEWPTWEDASLENADPSVVTKYLERVNADLFVHAGTDLPGFFTPIDGDIDGDGFVGISDLNIVLGAWNQAVPPGNPLADIDDDGFIGIGDLNVVLGNWNAGTPPPGDAVVPEPGTVAVLIIGLPAALLRRRAHR